MTTHGNDDLVSCAVNGDGEAWQELVQHYQRYLRWIAYSFRLSDAQAEDAAQATWLKLVQHIGTLREPHSVGGWLSVTMRRQCIRVASRQRREELRGDWSAHDLPSDDGVEARVLMAERDATLWHAVDQLPARQRQLIRCLFATPTPTYLEVSQRLSMPVGSIGPVRERALRALERQLNRPDDLTNRRAARADACPDDSRTWGSTPA
jgi:RNA polymerase sigma factor (sigma-70 family)